MILNGKVLTPPLSPDVEMFHKFKREVMDQRGWVPFRTEFSVFHVGLSLAGQADLICREGEHGDFIIVDWKRTKDLDPNATAFKSKRLRAPLAHLQDTKYSHYCLQLNLYRYIMETEYGMKVVGMYLAVFHPEQSGSPKLVKVPRLEKEMHDVVEFMKGKFEGIRDPQPMDSQFLPASIVR
jgi:hypothetical protein